MPNQDFLPRSEDSLDSWEANYLTKLTSLAPLLGLEISTVADMTSLINSHRAAYSAALAKQNEAKAANLTKMDKLNIVIPKIRAVAKQCKAAAAYTPAMGAELGIIGIDHSIDLINAKPVVTHVSYLLDMIVLDWIKGYFHGVVIYGAKRTITSQQMVGQTTVSSGANGENPAGLLYPQNLEWEEIGRDFRSPYEDKRRNLSEKPEFRYYKLKYLFKDEIVGVYSDVVSVVAEIF